MKNTSKWSTQPPDLIDCENMSYAIADDFGCITDVRIDWRAAGVTQIRTFARKPGVGTDQPALAQALEQFSSKSTTPVAARVWRLLFDLYIQLDALAQDDLCSSMPSVTPRLFNEWRRNRS